MFVSASVKSRTRSQNSHSVPSGIEGLDTGTHTHERNPCSGTFQYSNSDGSTSTTACPSSASRSASAGGKGPRRFGQPASRQAPTRSQLQFACGRVEQVQGGGLATDRLGTTTQHGFQPLAQRGSPGVFVAYDGRHAGGQFGLALPEGMAGGQHFAPHLADCFGQRARLFQRQAGFVPSPRLWQKEPDVPGRGSNARVDRGGPHQAGFCAWLRADRVLKLPAGRLRERLAGALERRSVLVSDRRRLQASIGHQPQIVGNLFIHECSQELSPKLRTSRVPDARRLARSRWSTLRRPTKPTGSHGRLYPILRLLRERQTLHRSPTARGYSAEWRKSEDHRAH